MIKKLLLSCSLIALSAPGAKAHLITGDVASQNTTKVRGPKQLSDGSALSFDDESSVSVLENTIRDWRDMGFTVTDDFVQEFSKKSPQTFQDILAHLKSFSPSKVAAKDTGTLLRLFYLVSGSYGQLNDDLNAIYKEDMVYLARRQLAWEDQYGAKAFFGKALYHYFEILGFSKELSVETFASNDFFETANKIVKLSEDAFKGLPLFFQTRLAVIRSVSQVLQSLSFIDDSVSAVDLAQEDELFQRPLFVASLMTDERAEAVSESWQSWANENIQKALEYLRSEIKDPKAANEFNQIYVNILDKVDAALSGNSSLNSDVDLGKVPSKSALKRPKSKSVAKPGIKTGREAPVMASIRY